MARRRVLGRRSSAQRFQGWLAALPLWRMSRDDLIATNTGIVKQVAENVARHSPKAMMIVVSNPLDAMVYVAWKASGFPTKRIMGQAGVLDVARYRSFLAMEVGCSSASRERSRGFIVFMPVPSLHQRAEVLHELDPPRVVVLHVVQRLASRGDRVIGLLPHPGRIGIELQIDLPRPRDQLATREHPEFLRLRRQLFDFIKATEQ